MAARRNRRGRRRNRGRFSALYKLLSVLIIFAAILMGCVVFLRVSTVEITGDSPYTEEEIRRVSGVEQGDNLFTLNKYQISSRIYTQLPYIGTVNFERKYPDTFVIHVTASVPVAWIESGGSRWLMDTDCKLLESGGASLTEGKAQVRAGGSQSLGGQRADRAAGAAGQAGPAQGLPGGHTGPADDGQPHQLPGSHLQQ